MKYVTTAFLLAAAHGTAQSMTDLGTLGGNYTYPYAVSADGSVIVGNSGNSGNQGRAFRWTAAGGMTDLGTLGG
ncbi:MAG: hypothetical protein ACO3HN_08725, partial [Opitutales bacterium]